MKEYTTEIRNMVVAYCIALGDDSLTLGHRLSEWSSNAPFLEEDLALTNVALDLIGRARMFYTYAGELEGGGRSEDDIAYLRDCREYRNFLINELPIGTVAQTYNPVLAASQVVTGLFYGLGGNGGEGGIGRPGQFSEKPHVIDVDNQLSRHGLGKVTDGQFVDQEITVLPAISQVGYVIFAAAPAFQFTRIGIKHSCPANQVKRHIGQCQVFFQERGIAAPFGQSMTQRQGVITERNTVSDHHVANLCCVFLHHCTHMLSTSLGSL